MGPAVAADLKVGWPLLGDAGLTAMGTMVNTTARLAPAGAAGEILVVVLTIS